MLRWLKVLLLGLPLALAFPGQAQHMPVPVAVQVPLFLKVLKYERGFTERVGVEMVMGVVYQERFRDSFNALQEFQATLDEKYAEELFGVPWQTWPISARWSTASRSTCSTSCLCGRPASKIWRRQSAAAISSRSRRCPSTSTKGW